MVPSDVHRSRQDLVSQRLTLLAAAVGVGLMLGATALFVWQQQRIAGMPSTIGTVTGYRDHRPVISYTVDGETWQIRGGRYRKNPLRIGQPVRIYYSPDAPAEGRGSSFSVRWLFPLFFFGIGVRFLMGAVALLRADCRRRWAESTSAHRPEPGPGKRLLA